MENINEENIQSFSVSELNELYDKTCNKISELDEQIDRLGTTRTEHMLFKDLVHEARAKKTCEEKKKRYEKYISKYFVRKASDCPTYYHFKSVIVYDNFVRLLGSSVTPFNLAIKSEDYFDIYSLYNKNANMLKEISKDEFNKHLQSVIETL